MYRASLASSKRCLSCTGMVPLYSGPRLATRLLPATPVNERLSGVCSPVSTHAIRLAGARVSDLLSVYSPTIWIVLFGTGIAIGLLAGLLGVGGGIVSVPVLLGLFAAMGMAE